MSADDEAAALARRQHGLVSLDQALGLRFSASQVRKRVRAGRWDQLRRGVYMFAGTPYTWEQLVTATVLSLGEGVFASHDTALRLLGGRVSGLDDIEVSSDRPRRIEMAGVRSHRSTVLFDADRGRRRHIPVTSPARVVVDLSSRRSTSELGRIVDDLVRRRLLGLPQLAACAARLRSAPGRSMARVHRVLKDRWEGYDPGDSDLESRVLRAIAGAGLPVPRQQFRVVLGGRRRYLDLAYPEVKLAAEIDSWLYHRDRSAFDGDRAKSNELVLLGWHVLRVTDSMSDEEIVRLIAAALEALGDFPAA